MKAKLKNFTVFYTRYYYREGQDEEISKVKNVTVRAFSPEDAIDRFARRRQGTLRCEAFEAIEEETNI